METHAIFRLAGMTHIIFTYITTDIRLLFTNNKKKCKYIK